jgi:hypothetical protein
MKQRRNTKDGMIYVKLSPDRQRAGHENVRANRPGSCADCKRGIVDQQARIELAAVICYSAALA